MSRLFIFSSLHVGTDVRGIVIKSGTTKRPGKYLDGMKTQPRSRLRQRHPSLPHLLTLRVNDLIVTEPDAIILPVKANMIRERLLLVMAIRG